MTAPKIGQSMGVCVIRSKAKLQDITKHVTCQLVSDKLLKLTQDP